MPASTIKAYNTFVKGIITEAGPLTFPENASIDEENCVLNRDGSRQRRLGMDYEGDYVLRPVTLTPTSYVASFRWESVANDATRQFGVSHAGTKLLVFDSRASSISANLLTTIDISSITAGTLPIQVASVLGYLVITGELGLPIYLEYNTGTGAITSTSIDIKVRDFFGITDSETTSSHPGSLTTAHNYNLRNQGWSSTNISAYFADQGNYPANNQQWFIGKDKDDNFSPSQLVKTDFGTTPAPKGRFIISPFNRSTDRNSQSGLSTAADIELSRPNVVGSAFQRVFYAGCKSASPLPLGTSPSLTGYVFFSRTVRSAPDFSQCYSDADPTSEIDSILVDTDGGYVSIPESGQIYKLVPKNDAMLVFAERGVWSIIGGADGFRATSFQVVKITEFGVLSGTSVVDAEELLAYWNRGGIYVVAPDPKSGFSSAQNITQNTIQTLFNDINQAGKKWATGAYDPINRKLYWMYNDSTDYDGSVYKNRYNKELILDIVINAFYKNSISQNSAPSPYMAGYLSTPDFLLRDEGIRNRGDSITKYLVVQYIDEATNSATLTFGYYRDPTFRDWVSSDSVGTSFNSFVLTGYEIMGDTARNKQAPYITVHSKQTEKFVVRNPTTGELEADNPSGLLGQTRWDWSISSSSGKWSNFFQAYRLLRLYILGDEGDAIDYGYEVITTKNRIPGRGKALSIMFKSDGDKDFYLYGWAIKFTGSQNV